MSRRPTAPPPTSPGPHAGTVSRPVPGSPATLGAPEAGTGLGRHPSHAGERLAGRDGPAGVDRGAEGGDAFLWRVEERRYAGGFDEFGDPIPGDRGPLEIRLFCVRVEKRTPKGWRLEGGRFVLESARKRWACPTVDEAFASFDARKRRQAGIHQARMMDALQAQNAAARLKERLVAELKPGAGRPGDSRVNSSGWLDGVRVEVKRHGAKEVEI